MGIWFFLTFIQPRININYSNAVYAWWFLVLYNECIFPCISLWCFVLFIFCFPLRSVTFCVHNTTKKKKPFLLRTPTQIVVLNYRQIVCFRQCSYFTFQLPYGNSTDGGFLSFSLSLFNGVHLQNRNKIEKFAMKNYFK